MKEIELTQGKVAMVDDADFEWLNQWKWHARKTGNTWYACRNVKLGVNKWTCAYMHRVIFPGHQRIDHKNLDGLDCQRNNLRVSSVQQNGANRPKQVNNTSGFKGVSWAKDVSKWKPKIQFAGKTINLGSFDTLEDAAKAYDVAARKYFGEFARTNYGD